MPCTGPCFRQIREFFSRTKEQWANCVNIYTEEAVSFTKPYPERLHSMPDMSFIRRLVLVDLVLIDMGPV